LAEHGNSCHPYTSLLLQGQCITILIAINSESFQLSSATTAKRVALFHDEREIRKKWLYHGILVVETQKADHLIRFLAETRRTSGSTKPVHFVELDRASHRSRTTKLAALWANAATGSLWDCARFYLLGIALDRLDRSVFGDDKTTINRNIYNRFFEVATFSALRWFYADEPAVEVVQAFSEKRAIAVDDAFPQRPITKINLREANITFRCRKIEMVNKHLDKEVSHPRAVPCLHLVDLLMGGISQCYDRTRSDEAALEIENILREPVARLQRNQFDPTYYKRFQVAWFPREPMSAAQLEAPLRPASFFNRHLPDDRAQTDFLSQIG
jgi:hypothetical protein